MTPEQEIAIRFHETYERLAPDYGYETRKDTREFDPDSANGKLMIAVCNEVMQPLIKGTGLRGEWRAMKARNELLEEGIRKALEYTGDNARSHLRDALAKLDKVDG
jgi:hypothetical protein